MSAGLKCPSCGAPYTAPVPFWLDYVVCSYCNGAVPTNRSERAESTGGRPEQLRSAGLRRFEPESFQRFLQTRKGVRTFDPVSGVLVLGVSRIEIDGSGLVTGSEPARTRVERWVGEYLST